MKSSRFALVSGLLLGFFAGGAAAWDYSGDIVKLNLTPGFPRDTLQSFADQTGWDVVYDPRDLLGVRMNEVKGEMPVSAALSRMLAGTGLAAQYDDFLHRVYICQRPCFVPSRRVFLQRAPRGHSLERDSSPHKHRPR